MKLPTLIKNEISADGRFYTVIIGTDMGQFSGTVEIRPEDEAYRSNYFGWELAEIKANIKYAKAKKKYYSAQLKALTTFWRIMSETRTYDIDAFWVKKMREEVDAIDKQVTFWQGRIDYLKEAYHLKIVTFDSFNSSRKRHEEHNYD